MKKAQGSLEYMVIIVAVLLVSGVVVYVVSGSTGSSVNSVNFEQCKTAANQCRTNHLVNAHDPCNFCEKACTVNGEDILNGTGFSAVQLCKEGNVSEIYIHRQIGCGNNIIEHGEACDGTNLSGQTCETQGYFTGTLTCSPDCKSYDTSQCTNCGNNQIDSGETCDGTALNGKTCQDFGFDKGTLSCYSNCSGYDTSGCGNYVCGNGIVEPGEQCDGTNLSGQTCETQGYDAGTLSCNSNCQFNTSDCDMAPVANFSTNCWHLDCDFNASNSTDSDGTIMNYTWDFGDGNVTTTTSPTISHHFTGNESKTFKDETYTVKLNATDDKGVTGSYFVDGNVYVTTNYAPKASISYTWDKLHAYTFDGSYSDPEGTACQDYAWDFDYTAGATTDAAGTPATHTYSSAPKRYEVRLRVKDGGGRWKGAYRWVVSNNAPVSSFTYENGSSNYYRFSFQSTSTPGSGDGENDSDKISDYIKNVHWDFGDGSSASSSWSPSHTFPTSGGDFNVNLTVNDSYGAATSSIQTVHVKPNNDPIANFTASCDNNNGCDLTSTSLAGKDATGNSDEDEINDRITKCWWDFNNDGTWDSPTPQGPNSYCSIYHSFPSSEKTVRLKAQDKYGASNIITKTVKWRTVSVDSSSSNVGEYTSLALDSNEYPHISYYDSANGDLKYAYEDASGWHTSTVDSTGNVGKYTSLALDSNNHPHIAYYDVTNGNLKYAWFDGSTWHVEILDGASGNDTDGDVGKYPSLALTSNNLPDIVYYSKATFSEIKYAYMDSSNNWHFYIVVRPRIVSASSLALDNNDHPHFIYFINTSSGSYNIGLADYDSSSSTKFSCTVAVSNVDEYSGNFSLALDSNNYPHISYYNNSHLNYAYKNSGGWHFETVDGSNNVGYYNSIALDSNNYPYISYFDRHNLHLKYAHKDSHGWIREVVDNSIGTGAYTSIALDPNDNMPRISYYDYGYSSPRQLKYAYYDWQ